MSDSNINEVAKSLLSKNPVKTLPAHPKRVRILLHDQYVVDTVDAVYVWEHEYYPVYYLPRKDFIKDALEILDGDTFIGKNGQRVSFAKLGQGGQGHVVLVVRRSGDDDDEMVRVPVNTGTWFEEEESMEGGHPKDPFKRVDVLFSSRCIRVFWKGTTDVVLAESRGGAWHLYETGLPVRFYLPRTAVKPGVLKESEKGTRTRCPYKGEAGYFDVVVGEGEGEEKRVRDGVWFYENPKSECGAVKGCLCFYNEKFDIELDGKLLERPKTKFS
ncbi:DUF427-domain-containing protein [Poronia punctata]|nr:DUF427-domain-containing protein [Poronia punctata]